MEKIDEDINDDALLEAIRNIRIEGDELMEAQNEAQNEVEEELGVIPMDYETYETYEPYQGYNPNTMELREPREEEYEEALEKLLANDIEGFLTSDIIEREFPKKRDELRKECNILDYHTLADFYPEYLALWKGTLRQEKRYNRKNPDEYILYKDILNSKGEKLKKIYKVIPVSCLASFQSLVDLVNTTKSIALKMAELRKYRYNFYNEIIKPIENALINVYQIFLK